MRRVQEFPMPHSGEQECRLLNEFLKTGDLRIRNEIVEHHLRLVMLIAGEYTVDPEEREEVFMVGVIGLIKAVNTFLPERGTRLSTYAGSCIRNEIYMYLRESSFRTREFPEEGLCDVGAVSCEKRSRTEGSPEDPVYESYIGTEQRRQMLSAVSSLTERERTIIGMRFGFLTCDGRALSQKYISVELGISQSYASREEKRILQKLRSRMAEQERGCV